MSDQQPQVADPVGIGRRLRELRVARGLLQQDLATAEISTSYVSLIEGGKRRPSPAVLAVLAERVGTSVEFLLTGRDENDLKNLRLELGFAEMALRNGAHEEALNTFNHTLSKASELAPELLLRARIGRASALEKLGRLEAAISLLHELLEGGELAPGSAQWAEVTVALCRCYRFTSDFNMSVEIGERGMRRLDELGLDVTDDHIMLGVDLVGSYHARGDYSRAQLLSNRLLAQTEANGSNKARGMVYWNASRIAESRGQRDEAIALVERALGHMAEADAPVYLARLKGVYAGMLVQSETGDLERARDLLEQAQETLNEMGNVHHLADCRAGLAMVDLRQGAFEDACERAGSALDMLNGDTGELASEILVLLGETQLLTGRTTEGESSLRQAARQLRQLPPSPHVATAYRYLGDVWQRHGNLQAAIQAYQNGLSARGTESTLPAPPQRVSAATQPVRSEV